MVHVNEAILALINRDDMHLPAARFAIAQGTPNQTSFNGMASAWMLDANSNESVSVVIAAEDFPGAWATFDVIAVGANDTAGSGDVVLRGLHNTVGVGDDAEAGFTTGNNVTFTAGAQYVLQTVTLFSGVPVPANDDNFLLRVDRRATEVADTLEGDWGLFKVVLRRST